MKSKASRYVLLFTITYFVSYITRINYGAIISEMERDTQIARSLLSMALLIWSCFRSLSRNLEARRRELVRYLALKRRVTDRFRLQKAKWRDRKTHVYFRCPKCRAVIRVPKRKAIIVDGYNIIFAWDDLAALAKEDLEAARKKLCDLLSNYAGFRKCYLVLVFDGWKVKGNPGEKTQYHNIQVVYTKEGETGDAYIEGLVAKIGGNYAVRVATSDSLVQLSSFRSGVLRMSARELREELELADSEMKPFLKK